MSNYAGQSEEIYPFWSRYYPEPFEYGPKMRLLANKLLVNTLEGDYKDRAIRVLCETAAISDSVECRTTLAQLAGLELSHVDIYKNAVGRNINNQENAQVVKVFEMAINAYIQKDFERYDLLTASVGFYPIGPEDLYDSL